MIPTQLPTDLATALRSYLQAFGHTVLAWIWLDLLVQAERSDAPVRAGIDAAAHYFFSHELPHVAAWLAPALAADRTIVVLDARAFE